MTAIGSAAELETQLEAAIRLQFVSRDRTRALSSSIDRLQKLLYGMRRERHLRLGITVASAGMIALLVFLRAS